MSGRFGYLPGECGCDSAVRRDRCFTCNRTHASPRPWVSACRPMTENPMFHVKLDSFGRTARRRPAAPRSGSDSPMGAQPTAPDCIPRWGTLPYVPNQRFSGASCCAPHQQPPTTTAVGSKGEPSLPDSWGRTFCWRTAARRHRPREASAAARGRLSPSKPAPSPSQYPDPLKGLTSVAVERSRLRVGGQNQNQQQPPIRVTAPNARIKLS